MLPAAAPSARRLRRRALPVILVATDTGFAYQPRAKPRSPARRLTLPISALTGTSRPTTPSSSGAGLQQTVTALNALGRPGHWTRHQPPSEYRSAQGLEALSMLTGAVNRSTTTIANARPTPSLWRPVLLPDASGFAGASRMASSRGHSETPSRCGRRRYRPSLRSRVKIIKHSGVRIGIGSDRRRVSTSNSSEMASRIASTCSSCEMERTSCSGRSPLSGQRPFPADCYEFEDLPKARSATTVSFGSKLATAPAPTVVSIAPFSGPTTGGYDVVITGSGFVVGKRRCVRHQSCRRCVDRFHACDGDSAAGCWFRRRRRGCHHPGRFVN